MSNLYAPRGGFAHRVETGPADASSPMELAAQKARASLQVLQRQSLQAQQNAQDEPFPSADRDDDATNHFQE